MHLPINLEKSLDQWGPIDANILYPSFWFGPTAGLTKKDYNLVWPPLLGVFEKGRLIFLWEKSKMPWPAQKAITNWLLKPKGFNKLRNDYKNVLKQGNTLKLRVTQLKANNVQALNNLAVDFYNFLVQFWITSLIFEIGNFGAPAYLKEKLQKLLPEKQLTEALEILLTPEALSFHQQEELELLQSFVQSPNLSVLKTKLKEHAKNWHWVNNSYAHIKNLDEKYFLLLLKNKTKLEAKKQIAQILAYTQNNRQKKIKFCKTYRLPSTILILAQKLSFSIWWQDERKGKLWQYLSLIPKFNNLAAKKYRIKIQDLLRYNAEEWRDLFLLGKKLNRKAITERKNFSVAVIGQNRSYFTSDKNLQRSLKKILQEKYKPAQSLLQGIVVSKGKSRIVTGRVKILLSPKQAGKFKPGEILVTPMTSPDFVPIMRKAKALITDVGGLMSHAAVVSREMAVPCIVGTKTATSFLKNGEKVALDLTKGAVQKL